jgi:hypothetical protein
MKVGVVIDSWKLQIFIRHLESAGYSWTQHDGLYPDTLILVVICDSKKDIHKIIKAANDECAEGALMSENMNYLT